MKRRVRVLEVCDIEWTFAPHVKIPPPFFLFLRHFAYLEDNSISIVLG